MELHPECADSAHPCLKCKLTIWRAESRSPLSRGRDKPLGTNGERFYDTTIAEERRRIIADAKRGGLDPVPADF